MLPAMRSHRPAVWAIAVLVSTACESAAEKDAEAEVVAEANKQHICRRWAEREVETELAHIDAMFGALDEMRPGLAGPRRPRGP